MSRSPRGSPSAILVVTPALVGGSWMLISELVRQFAGEAVPVIAAIGPKAEGLPAAAAYRAPWLDYEEFGPKIDRNLAAVLWFAAPLVILSILLWMRYRPRIWLGNGLLAAAIGIVPQKISGGHVLVSYNAYMSEDKPTRRLAARSIARHVSLVLVNSQGSYVDAETFAARDHIKILPLSADDLFFRDGNPAEMRRALGLEDRFVVAFVGRLDREKHCEFLLDVARRCGDASITFLFVGHGPMKGQIETFAAQRSNVLCLGRVLDRSKLRDIYQVADVVWSYADETYLAKPAVEALASGTPIVVPDLPAILVKSERGAKIDPRLVPESIGWIVDCKDPAAAARLVVGLSADRTRVSRMRLECREYARSRYSSESAKPVLAAILRIANSRSPNAADG